MKIAIIVPCYNEEAILEKNIKEILEAVKKISYDFEIVISDNASDDRTGEIGKKLAEEIGTIKYIYVATRGKGAAVLEAWKKIDADVYGFMDADLATDLSALQPAMDALRDHDVVIGSRRMPESDVHREAWRKVVSATLTFIIRLILKSKLRDTACGFKFFKKPVLDIVMPRVKDRRWTFDTELVVFAERAGFKIKELSVKWEEKGERPTRLRAYSATKEYLKKIWELRRG